MHSFLKYVNPFLGKLINDVNMDKSFVRGEGCCLYDHEGNEYLDFIGAYGALPFGHNPREIWSAIIESYDEREPNFVQPSNLNAAGDLAEKLIGIAPEGLKYVTFTNSGAEAVEAAIKMCRAATGRKGILSAANSFHGKTLGALSATGNLDYQRPFMAPAEGFDCVEYGDLKALETLLAEKPDEYAALILEPIQGEGGVVEPPTDYLKGAKELCEKYGLLLVLDEIQTGLGRTGSLFVCEEERVSPDILLLAKALSGGVIPIGACLSNDKAYHKDFALKHSSTFAGNTTACRAGIRSLEMLLRNDMEIINAARSTGDYLKNKLLLLKEKYPDIIGEIRGRGLMLGISFDIDRESFPGSLLGIMAEQELLTPVLSGYLLNVEYLRVAPTLNGNKVIRIEPPLCVSKEQCDRAVQGLENLLQVLAARNSAQLLSFLIDAADKKYPVYSSPPPERAIRPSAEPQEGRFAFLIHPLYMENYAEFDPSLAAFDGNELQRLVSRWNEMVSPFPVAGMRVVAETGAAAYGEFIAVPRTAEQLMGMPQEKVLAELREAVSLARRRGAKIVGLGAYTSIASRGGLYLMNMGIPLTTGNSYTVVAAVEAINSALEKMGELPGQAQVALVGASGAIGKGIAILMSEKASGLVLIGNPRNKDASFTRLWATAAEIYRFIAGHRKKTAFIPGSLAERIAAMRGLPDPDAPMEVFIKFAQSPNHAKVPISISTQIDEWLPYADIVVSATSSTGSLIVPEILKYGAIVCDISRPSNVSDEVLKQRPDVLVIDGGVVEVPGRPSLGWNFGFEKGHAYACMSETMMLALDQHYENTSLGSAGITPESILYTRKLAAKYGFKLANMKSFNRPLTAERWDAVMKARSRGNPWSRKLQFSGKRE
ncbi:MAG: aminotransferase class III-fold pyridoxal phosphate-dependent enzyme [Dethiobacteria bacterium]